MKLDSFLYLTKEGLKNIFSNWVTSLTSITILVCCLFLTGSTILFSTSVNNTLDVVESKNNLTIHLLPNVSSEDAKKIEEKIQKIPNISHCEFYSKDQAIQKYSQALGNLMEGLKGEDNPLPDVFHIRMLDLSKYDETAKILSEIEGVESLSDRREIAKRLTDVNQTIKLVEIGIVILFAVVSLFIVSNTIRVTMYGRRMEISIMKSVGATNFFIRLPFIIEGILIGFVSALISSGFLKLLSNIVLKILRKIIPFTNIIFDGVNATMTVVFLLIGVIFGFVGGVISIRKYLNKEGDVIALQ
ncbi:MAG: permease-like cell division protein FtsX [Oscillospiraceae bacterium]|jgi:cell division transport system permease protein|nr:permease-like cell division protein FtsX [Oscillospiraceae bacterium]